MAQPTTNAILEATRAQWDAAAEGWDAQAPALNAWLSGPTETMAAMAGIGPGSYVLDIAAGAGDQSLVFAERVGSQGRIVAVDLSPALLERLRVNARAAGYGRIEARVADAQAPLSEVGAFDAAACRLGLMLMPEPARCISAVRSALKPGGGFSAMVFAGPEENPCIRILMATTLRHAGLEPRDPYAPGGLLSLGKPGHLKRLFEAEGFREVSTLRIEAPMRLPSVHDYVAFLRVAAAPIRSVLSHLSLEAQDAAWQDIRAQLAVFQGPDGWTGPNTLLLTTGRK